MSDSARNANEPSHRLDEASVRKIVGRTDASPDGHANSASRPGDVFPYLRTVRIELVHADGRRLEIRAPTRSISRLGFSFFHRHFVHRGTQCNGQLITVQNSWEQVEGVVADCWYIERGIHEIEVRLNKPLDVACFSENAIHRQILVIDSDPLAVKLAQYHLARLNCSVTVAADGNEALQLLRSGESFDLVLIELDIPGLDGVATLRRLREASYCGNVVAMSCVGTEQNRDRCLLEGFNQFVQKPLTRDSVKSLLCVQREEALFSTLAGEESMVELINHFVANLPALLQGIEKAIAAHDIEALGRLVRCLKGTAGGYGFEMISQAAGTVESRLAPNADFDQIRLRVRDLSQLCRMARPASTKAHGSGAKAARSESETV